MRVRYSTLAPSTSPRLNVPRSTGSALERASLRVGGERRGERLEIACEDVLQACADPDPVIGDTVLLKVVRADLLGPLTRPDLRLAGRGRPPINVEGLRA